MAKEKEVSLEKKIEGIEFDKEKMVKEIKEEVKEGLEEELLDTIEYETRNKLDSMEKRIYKYKNRTIRKKNFIILILIVILIIESRLLYDSRAISKYFKIDSGTTNYQKVEEEEKNLEWYIKKYGYLLEDVKTNLDEDHYTYLYEKSYSSNDILNNVKLNMVFLSLDSKDITKNNSIISVKNEKMMGKYQELFLNDEYREEDFNNGCVRFVYNKNNDTYMAIDIECDNAKKIEEEITNISDEDNLVVIETVVGLYDGSRKVLSTVDGDFISDNYKENLVSYKNQLNQYRYTFTKREDMYYFTSIERLK